MRADVPSVAIQACSARTSFGNLSETWEKLLAGASIDDHTRLECASSTRRALTLARSVAAEVVPASGLARDVAVIVGTSKGSVEDWFIPPPLRGLASDKTAGGLSVSGLGDIAAELSRDCGTDGPVLTLSAACASGLHALIRGAMMIQAGEASQTLIVATEASVHPLFVGSFRRLGVLAEAGSGCRPFDRNRTGFYVSEAACAVLLTADAPHPRIFVDRFALGGDATHLTGSDPDGRTLKHLLSWVIDGRPIDLIHAHGTGTELNDATELAAIETVLGKSRKHESERPIVYSHKGALGHSLGASGLLSVVLNCMSHSTGIVPPNVRTTAPLPVGRVLIPQAITERRIRRSVAIAAGFGGPVAAIGLVSE